MLQPLMRLCRTAIRKSIGTPFLEKRIGLLPLPTTIKDYLLLKDSIYLPNAVKNQNFRGFCESDVIMHLSNLCTFQKTLFKEIKVFLLEFCGILIEFFNRGFIV